MSLSGEIKNLAGGHNYFFAMPAAGIDAHKAAMKLMEIDGVSEVVITGGDCGFVVKSRQMAGNDRIAKKISDAIGGPAKKAVCHCRYISR